MKCEVLMMAMRHTIENAGERNSLRVKRLNNSRIVNDIAHHLLK